MTATQTDYKKLAQQVEKLEKELEKRVKERTRTLEIQISNLIMQGATSKKIGEIMEISPRTVDAHRKNIRKKIGLQQKRVNLRSYLLSLH